MLKFLETIGLDILRGVGKVAKNLLEALRNLWKSNPARVVAFVASAVVFVAAKFGIVVPEQTVLEALAYIVPILFGGEVTRGLVSPASKPASK